MGLHQTIVHEDGDKVYLVAPVSPIEPSAKQIEEYAFGPSIVETEAKKSPNPFIKWYGGHYVEADRPNGNGAMWTANEIALKSLTPRFMPVTVMHDPSTAVGLIADVALLQPPVKPRNTLETALALWAHRFPEVVEEAQHNYAEGSLMQSMECLAPAYSCAECGIQYLKLPHGAEKANWCEHLKSPTGVRTLEATTFTGTGLIFGTRGASGADPLAHLEDFKQEVAEFHQRKTAPAPIRTSTRSKHTMDIDQDKYDALMARPTQEALDTERARADRSEKEFERVEAENVKLRDEVTAQTAEIATFQEQANQATLASDRLGKLGNGFLAKLGEVTRKRLNEQAGKLKDDEWSERIAELAELTGLKTDAKLDGTESAATTTAGTPAPDGTPVFSAEEVARQQIKGDLDAATPSDTAVTRGVIQGLISRPAAAKK